MKQPEVRVNDSNPVFFAGSLYIAASIGATWFCNKADSMFAGVVYVVSERDEAVANQGDVFQLC